MITVKKVTKHTLLLIVGLFTGIFITGLVTGIKDHIKEDKSEAIKTVLTENCDCESVNQFIYAKGIQFSKADGLSTEKAEYELVNCSYDNINEEVNRINKMLVTQVKGYEDVDLLKLEFVGAEKHETFTIKNAIVQ